jgi:fibronectin-binding autotransporter adhesin
MMTKNNVFCASLFFVFSWSSAALAATPLTVGPFDVYFYNNGESNGIETSTQNWTAEQINSVVAGIGAWSNRLVYNSGRQVKLDLFLENLLTPTLGDSLSPTYGDGATSWTYAEHILRDGVNYNGSWSGFDAQIRFNYANSWNFGSALPSWDQYDFRSVVTHEIGHMLGINDSLGYDSVNPLNSTWGNCFGTASSPINWAGYQGLGLWDKNLQDDAGNRPLTGSTGTPTRFNITDNPVWFTGSHAVAYNGGNLAVYAPDPYVQGSSLAHLDSTAFPQALMGPVINQGAAIRNPSPLEWEVMKDLGWVVRKYWTKGAGTLNWQTADNWDYAGAPDDMTQVNFFNSGLTNGDAINLGGNCTVDSLAFDTAINCSIAGTGTLTIKSGRITRSDASSGSQTIAANVALGSNAVWTISGTALLSGTNEFKVTGAISGGYSLEKRGNGILTLGGLNTYSGGTLINAGEIHFTSSNAIGGYYIRNLKILSGATAALDFSGVQNVLNTRIDTSSTGSIALTAVNAGETIDFATAALVNISLGALGSVTFTGTFVPIVGIYRLGSPSGTLTFAKAINSGSVIVGNGGTVVLTKTNVYTGGTTIGAGSTLSAESDMNIGVGKITLAGGTLNTGTSGAAAFTSAKPFQLTADSMIDVDSMNISTISGIISGNYGLVKTGTGKLLLSNSSNNYAGTTTISEGVLSISATGCLGGGNIILAGGTLNTGTSGAAAFSSSKTISVTLDSTIDVTSTNTTTLSGTLSNTGTTGNYGFTKTGSGKLVLSNTYNTYSGTTAVQVGILSVSAPGSLGAGNIFLGGGTLQTTGANAFNTAKSITLTADSTIDAGNTAGTVLSGRINGGYGLTKSGAGLLWIQAAASDMNTYSGPTTVLSGTLQLSGTGAAPANILPRTTYVTLGSGTLSAVLKLSDTSAISQELTGLYTSGTGTNNQVIGNSFTGNSKLILNVAGTDIYDGILGLSGGTNENRLELTKAGLGSLTLTNTNYFTGTTTIVEGNIIISNSQALGTADNPVNVLNGASLQLQNNVTVTGKALNLTGSGAGGSGVLRNISGANTWTGTVTIAGTPSSTAVFQSDSGTLTLGAATAITCAAPQNLVLQGQGDGVISGSIVLSASYYSTLTKNGAGTWSLASTTYAPCVTLINSGILSINTPDALGYYVPPLVGINPGGTLALNFTGGVSSWVTNSVHHASLGAIAVTVVSAGESLNFSNFSGLSLAAVNAATYTGTFTPYSDGSKYIYRLGGNGALTFAPLITSNSVLDIVNGGRVYLSAANDYTGGTVVQAGGMLGISSSNNLGNCTVFLNGGTLSTMGTASITLPASKPIVLTADSILDTNNTSGTTIQGTISGDYGLTKTGAGDLTFSGSYVNTDVLEIQAGTLSISGDITGSGTVNVTGGSLLVHRIVQDTLSFGDGASVSLVPIGGGSSPGSSSNMLSAGGANQVPEPGMLILMAAGSLCFIVWRCSGKKSDNKHGGTEDTEQSI